jgi:hypothetical protein
LYGSRRVPQGAEADAKTVKRKGRPQAPFKSIALSRDWEEAQDE